MKFSLVIFFVALLIFGCSDSPKTKSSNSIDLENTEVLDKIIEGAIYDHKLQKRGDEGEELVYLTNKQTPYTGWVKKMWENGQVKELGHFKNGELDGLKNTWYENGQKENEATYKKGRRNGVCTRWWNSGHKHNEINYKYGEIEKGIIWNSRGIKIGELKQKDGELLRTFWIEGHWDIKYEQNYKEGEVYLCTGWYENGQKHSVINFIKGKQNGLRTLWYKNGQKKEEGNFKYHREGGPKKHGSHTYWYKTGDKSHEVYHVNGRWMSALSWKPNGKKCPDTNLENGNGLVILYGENGPEKKRSSYKNGYPVSLKKEIVKPTVVEAKNTKDDKFKQMILKDIDKVLTSKKPIGSKPDANKIEQDDDVNAKKTPPINSKVKEKENDHGTNCVCKECRAVKIGKGGIFPNL